ncbi:hypothetical protein ACF1AB_25455 [Streptomyces sp. NPDC014846]|uniref:hypothetical protein n=1 Tax=Streptomyces sp. NPDC014846 TaxID=3364922 RepID=UPI0036FCB520
MRRSTALRLAAASVLAGLAATACGTGAADDPVNAGPSSLDPEPLAVCPYLRDSLDAFAECVIPELRRRSRFRTHYTCRTLRDHLDLPRSSRRA